MSDPLGGFWWDDNVKRWRDARGHFTARSFIIEQVDARIEAGFERLQDMLAAVVQEGAPVGAWQEAVYVELRRARLQMTALGYGGWDRVPASGWGRAGASLRRELEFLRGFAQDLADGKLSEAQARARLAQYEQGVRTAYWEAKGGQMADSGAVYESSHTTPADHCDGCLREEARGIVPLGSLVPVGSRDCGSRCKCEMRWYDEHMREIPY